MDQVRPVRPPAQRPVTPVHQQDITQSKVSTRLPKGRLISFILTLIIIVLLIVAGWFLYKQNQSGSLIDSGKYQAVLLSNGQWYFGKLQEASGSSYKLTDVFYLEQQNGSGTQQSETKQLSDTTKPVLVKLGSEIHAPEDSMIIKSDQLVFYENIKDSGQVASLMKQYMEKNKN